jgi:outer membrane murein-binding lipoprotein Lpp
MKKSVLLVIPLLSLFFFGCASKDYVRQQIEPLVDRISKLETRVSSIESRVSALEGKVAEIDEAKREAQEAKAGSSVRKRGNHGGCLKYTTPRRKR